MIRQRVDETSRKFQEYQQEFQIPILPTSQQENTNPQAFYKLYPELTPYGAIKPHQAQAFNPEKTRLFIESLQKQNVEIYKEVKQQANDIIYLTQIVNKLIDENRSLGKLLSDKDYDLHTLIETATIHETEEISDLKHQLRILEDENSVLIKHVQQQKEEIYQRISERDNIEKQFQNSKQYCSKLEQQLNQCKITEETLSKEMQLYKERFQAELDMKNQLTFEGNKKDSLIISLNQHVEKLDQQLQTLTTDYEILQNNKIDQYSQSSEKIYELSQQIDYLNNEVQKLQITNNGLLQELNDYNKEVIGKQLVCDRLADQCDDIMGKLSMEIQRQQVLQQNELKLQEQLGQLILQNSEYYTTIEQQSQQLKQLIDQSEEDLSLQKQKYDQHIEKKKKEYQEEIAEKQSEIEELYEKNNKETKEIQKLKLEIQQLKSEIEINKSEMNDYQQQKKIIEQLQINKRQLTLQLQENKSLLNEFTTHKTGVQADIEERDKKIKEIIYQKDNRIEDLEKECAFYQEQYTFLRQHQKNNEDLERQNYALRSDKEILEQEIIQNKNEIDRLQQQINYTNTTMKSQKIKADQSIMEENIQLRQQCNDLNQEVQRLREVSFNTLPITIKQQSEGGSRVKQPQSQDFQQTKPNQVYLQPQIPVQASSPHHSQHSHYSQKRQDSVKNVMQSDDGSVKGLEQKKDLQYSFADQRLQQQQHEQIQRRQEREGSHHSSMSNAPYRKKP